MTEPIIEIEFEKLSAALRSVQRFNDIWFSEALKIQGDGVPEVNEWIHRINNAAARLEDLQVRLLRKAEADPASFERSARTSLARGVRAKQLEDLRKARRL
jgi:hypothetical protein